MCEEGRGEIEAWEGGLGVGAFACFSLPSRLLKGVLVSRGEGECAVGSAEQ